MSRIVQPDEFYARLIEVLRHTVGQFGSVTGPGRSGAIASVYASHLLGIPWLPYVWRIVPKDLQPTLIIDTAMQTGATLRKAQRRTIGPSETLALFQEPPRVKFWYEGSNDTIPPDVMINPPRPDTTWVLAKVTLLGPATPRVVWEDTDAKVCGGAICESAPGAVII